MARIPNQQRVDPIGRAPIADSSGVATDFFARQWKNLVDLVTSVITLQDDSVANAARITALEGTEIGGTAGQITPLPAPLSAGNITLELANTAATPGTYGDATNVPQITVDQKGRITGVVSVPITGGGGGGGGGGSCWELVATRTIAAGTTTEDITGLGDYDDLLVILEGSTSSSSQSRGMRVSTDSGATFLSTSGDYQSVAESGSQGSPTIMSAGTATTAARTCWWWLTNKNSTDDPKIVRTNDSSSFLIRTALPIDAVQLRNGTVGTLSSGTVYVFGLICGGGGGGGGGGGTNEARWYRGSGPFNEVCVATATGGSSGDPNNSLNGIPTNSFFWNSGTATKTLTFDFDRSGTDVNISGVFARQSTTASQGTWQLAWSNDNITYNNVGATFDYGGALAVYRTIENNNYARYWRCTLVSGSSSNAPFITQYGFKLRFDGDGGGGGGGGGGDVAVEDDGVSIVAAASTLNFTGAGVVVTDAGGGQVDIDIEPVELFLGPSDETDDSDSVYFYFGWISINGSWLVRRQTRATSLTLNANIVNNASYANLAAAWPARTSLIYS